MMKMMDMAVMVFYGIYANDVCVCVCVYVYVLLDLELNFHVDSVG